MHRCAPTESRSYSHLINRIFNPVYGLFILETVQTALCTHDGMKWFAGGFGDVSVLNKPEFSTIDNPVLDAVIAIIVQLTLCWRIWVCTVHQIITS